MTEHSEDIINLLYQSLPISPLLIIIMDYYSNPMFNKVLKDISGYKSECEYLNMDQYGTSLDTFRNYGHSDVICSMFITHNLITDNMLIENISTEITLKLMMWRYNRKISFRYYYIKCRINKLTLDNIKDMLVIKNPIV